MKRLADQTLYEILEVPADAPAAEIQAAYDRARALYAPGSLATYTLMTPDEAALLTSRIEDAHGTLLDPEARARYDETLLRRAGEVRAAAGGAGGATTPFPSLPPVIPAVQPGGGAAREGAPLAAPPASEGRPAIPLGAVLEAPGAAPGPILLQREVPAESPAPPAGAPAFPAPPLPEAWTGEALRKVREARGISVKQIAERTKVTRHHIENLEADRFGALPAQVYLRGILLALARELRLDGQKVARSYLERLAALAPPPGAPRGK